MAGLEINDPALVRLTTRLERERCVRLEAESTAERGLRELFQRQQEVVLLETIAEAANTATSVHQAMQLALDRICEYTKWPIGCLSLITGDLVEGTLEAVPAGVWHAPDADMLRPFREMTDTMRFPSGVGLPGRILATGKPAWITDLTHDPAVLRELAARQCGLGAAFGFPVLAGSEVVAVLEFFAEQGVAPDSRLLELMTHIGTQLGRVVERQRAHERMIDAFHDPLTHLPNRALFRAELERAVRRALRHSSYLFAVLFLDLDSFKAVNDSLGHMAGDQLLVQIAGRLAAELRLEDAVARSDRHQLRDGDPTVARLGGDEFTILLSGIREVHDGLRVAERIQQKLTAPFLLGDQEVFMSTSIGIASSLTGYSSADDILRDADIAMYRAKAQGKGRCQLFDPAMQRQAMARLQLETDLRHAIARAELRLPYQPIVSLDGGTTVGFEALLRWDHPQRGTVFPMELIPLAEHTGMDLVIGDWVLRQACQQLRVWQDRFPQDPPLTMTINLSMRQFMSPDTLDQVDSAMRETRVAPMSVSLELTEGQAMSNPERFRETVTTLKRLGVRIAMDDFGTGYSSLSYLTRFPIDTLKIDRAFVSRMDEDKQREVIRAIVMLATILNLDVVAEGTEEASQAEQLRSLGCRFAQGYLFSQPLDALEMHALLEQKHVPGSPCPH